MRILSLSNKQAERYFWTFFLAFHAVQFFLVLVNPFSLSGDESHYWQWSKSLDISYYSKGPLMAYLISASTSLFGDTEFAVRAPALLCSVLTSLVLYSGLKVVSGAQAALLTFILIRTSVFFFTLGLFMTSDPPAILFWLGSLVLSYKAVTEDKQISWVLAGLCAAVAVLSKYTALVIFPSLLFFLLFTPALRKHILSLGFIVGALLSFAGLIPTIFWNMKNSWVNFSHNAGHVVSQKGFALKLKYLPELLGGQIGLIGPLLFVILVWSLVIGLKKWREGDSIAGLFVSFCLPLLVVCLGVSLGKRVYANWPMPLWLSLFFLFSYLVSSFKEQRESTLFKKILKPSIYLNSFLCLVCALLFMGVTFGLPVKVLTTKKLAGWSELGAHVAKVQQEIDKESVIIADSYELASSLSFYMPNRPKTYCGVFGGRRMNQFDVWAGWDEIKGKNAIIVLKITENQDYLSEYFDSVRPLERDFDVYYAGENFKSFKLFYGLNYNGKYKSPASF